MCTLCASSKSSVCLLFFGKRSKFEIEKIVYLVWPYFKTEFDIIFKSLAINKLYTNLQEDSI